jgi:hypothetical protein
MKKIGYILISVGFVTGSLVSVMYETEVNWPCFWTAIAVGVLGVGMVRLGHRQITHAEGNLTSNIQDVTTSLERIVHNTAQLNTDKDSIDTYDMRHRIDELIAADILTFADARGSITTLYGLKTYADIMNHFAAGERYLNRVWSASADGYIDEVNAYIEKSNDQFTQALTLTRQAQQDKPAL